MTRLQKLTALFCAAVILAAMMLFVAPVTGQPGSAGHTVNAAWKSAPVVATRRTPSHSAMTLYQISMGREL